MKIRQATTNDIEVLLELERKCWLPHLRATSDDILSRLTKYPQGQYVAEDNNKIYGVLYTQRIKSINSLIQGNFKDQFSLHHEPGEYILLLAIAALQSSQGNVGALLRNHVIDAAKSDNNIRKIVAMTRCSKFKPDSSLQYEKYVESGKDPTIFFHISGGAEILKIVKNYRSEDTDNLGNAILIAYHIKEFEITETKDSFFQDLCQHVCYLAKSESIDVADIPFLNILDSFQLLTLHNWIEARLNKKLSPNFLFSHSTCRFVQKFINGDMIQYKPLPIENSKCNDIAIVGVSMSFPSGISDLSRLRKIMLDKQSTSKKVPLQRWDVDALHLDKLIIDSERESCLLYGNFLDNIEMFDPSYFGMSMEEAMNLDPCHRLILQSSFDSLYDAGIDNRLDGRLIGIWVGLSSRDYQDLQGKGNT
jgi:hypothetical protein